MSRRGRAGVLAAWAALALVLGVAPAQAAEDSASITHVKPTREGLQILVSLPVGAQVDLSGVTVTVDGKEAEASAAPADSSGTIRRTTVLAIDTSRSMAGERFAAAQTAAETFLDTVPDDVYVGITTFAGEVTPALAPTLDRDQARSVIEGLTLSRQTRLYDGVIAAAKMAGSEGQRNVLVLSDGADTSATPLTDATSAIKDGELLVDVVALDQSSKGLVPLESLAEAGSGQVISADPAALEQAFTDEADALARQIVVTTTVPEGVTADEGDVTVALPVGDTSLTASAFVPLQKQAPAAQDTVATPQASDPLTLPGWAMYVGVGLLGLGLVTIFTMLVPAPARTEMSPDERVSKYAAMTGGSHRVDDSPNERDAVVAQAKKAATQMLKRNKSLEARIASRLEGAGSELKPAEWLLLHTSILLTAGLLGMLIGGGALLVGLLFAAGGLFLPWAWLGFRKGRRLKAFNASLPDTLQLLAGSLQAGLSLQQSVDTIVREGNEPISSEFKRVLVETRLGVSLEDALEGITERFESKDFAWIVMAIKIQRQVGGNLAELLNTVAATIREREYMRRQVAALAAEGKMSAYVIGGLPPAFLIYLLMVNRDYVMPMFTDPKGWLMLAGGALLLGVGIFWMSRLVKVEV
ncbi:MAG TPA: type II secretion system F family protein [Nocardioides sp.]|uniref:type II secretion system F family protein n=1 Tax=Nocardioides sp. TaxID=35761 RepID=UPI002B920F49|nr:type II secretion system F family protein [Nocardioides sp.]HQR27742.1 type II secretion system F family protein [Nocardioides sp.]